MGVAARNPSPNRLLTRQTRRPLLLIPRTRPIGSYISPSDHSGSRRQDRGAILDREGIGTIGDLAHTPSPASQTPRRRISPPPPDPITQGIDPRINLSPRKSVGMERTFEGDVRSRTQIRAVHPGCLHDCARRLRPAGSSDGPSVSRCVARLSYDHAQHQPGRTHRHPDAVSPALRSLCLLKEDMPHRGVRLFGVASKVQSRSDGVIAVTWLRRKNQRPPSVRWSIRSSSVPVPWHPTLLGTQVPARRSFGGDAAQDGQGSRSAEASAPTDSGDAGAVASGDAPGRPGSSQYQVHAKLESSSGGGQWLSHRV